MSFDAELCFWIVAVVVGWVVFGLLMARANRDLYVDWIAEYARNKK